MAATDLMVKPDHVPAEHVYEYPLIRRETIYESPYDRMIPEVHENYPPAFMALNAFLGIAPAWIFRKAEHVKQIYLDQGVHFIKKGNGGFSQSIGETWDSIPTELDPPRHTAVRRVLNPLFTPAKVAVLESKVRDRAREYIDAFKDKGGCNITRDFCVPYPVSIFIDLLGLPQDGMDQYLEWEYQLLNTPDPSVRAAGVRAVKAFLMDEIEKRRLHPTDDLISNALNLRVDGEPLSPIEVFGHCFNLYIGGLDTVASTLGMFFYHLARNPEQQRQLRKDPSLIKPAINEMARAYSIVSNHRVCGKDIDIAGVYVKKGDMILVPLPVAGRDPEAYENPNEIRFDRDPLLVTFGYGIHRCLGIYLAQRELQVALEEMFAATPEFRIADNARIPFRLGNVMHIEDLPLVWG